MYTSQLTSNNIISCWKSHYFGGIISWNYVPWKWPRPKLVGNCYIVFPIIHCASYIMSFGETRRTQSAIFFNRKTKDGEEGNSTIPSKRKRDELTLTMLVEQTSTSTLIGDNETTHCSRQLRSSDKNKEQIALKQNQLKGKAVRYKSHKDFLSRCIAKELIPKGLKHELEPTIGNYDQEFVDTRYSKLKKILSNINERYCSSLRQNHC